MNDLVKLKKSYDRRADAWAVMTAVCHNRFQRQDTKAFICDLNPEDRRPCSEEECPVFGALMRLIENRYKSEGDKCPKCGLDLMVKRRRSDGVRFLGCVTYPECKGTRDFDPEKHAHLLDPEEPGYKRRELPPADDEEYPF